jgi:hypothetical protein
MNEGIGVGEQMCPGRMGVDEPGAICHEMRWGHERPCRPCRGASGSRFERLSVTVFRS